MCGNKIFKALDAAATLLQFGHARHIFAAWASYEQLLELHAGITIQAPQLDINTVAAGGGSRLFFRQGIFQVCKHRFSHPAPSVLLLPVVCHCPSPMFTCFISWRINLYLQ